MSRFLFATDARLATNDALQVTASSLLGLGLGKRHWLVVGESTAITRRRLILDDVPAAEWVIFISVGDRITRDALHFAAKASPDVDVLYGDTRHDIKRHDRLPTYQRRPSYSPERLRSHNYIGNTLVARREVVDRVGGVRFLTGLDPHDRNLRICEAARQVVRIAEIFDVTSSQELLPPANVHAVSEHLLRVGIDAIAEFDSHTPAIRIRRKLQIQPTISVIIPTRGSSATLRGARTPLVVNAVRSLLEKATYRSLQFVIVVDSQTPQDVRAELELLGGKNLLLIDYDQAFNFALKNNIGVAHSSGEYVLLLNDDTEIITPDALETMLAIMQDSGVGIVGPLLHFEDGSIQSAGHVFTPDPTDMYRLQPADVRGAHNYVRVQREVSSVIAACLLTSRKVYEEVGGLSTQFPGNWNDIDFALKVQQAGYRVIFTPHARFFHFESKTRVPLRIESEVARLGERWGDILDDDPYFNPRLQRFINVWRSDFHTNRSYEEALGPTT